MRAVELPLDDEVDRGRDSIHAKKSTTRAGLTEVVVGGGMPMGRPILMNVTLHGLKMAVS